MGKTVEYLEKLFKYLIPIVLVAWCATLLAQKIDLSTADLGRHIENGRVLVHGSWAQKTAVLHTNFYSYTEPDTEFVNHHWLSGVVFYFTNNVAGFKGLSILYIAVVSAAFFLFFRTAQKIAGTAVAGILGLLVLPIIASRTEVRPEGFTYLGMAVFFFLLWHWKKNPNKLANYFILIFLPLSMLLWVNLHIGFIFGFLILGAFWLEELIQDFKLKIKDRSYRFFYYRLRLLTIVGVLCVIAALVNPFFIKGLLFPLRIFENYGYLVVENQSIGFLERLGMGGSLHFGLFKVLLGLAAFSFFARALFERKWKEFPYHNLILLLSVGALSFLSIRNFPVFGLLLLPIAADNIQAILPRNRHAAYRLMPVVLLCAVLLVWSGRFLQQVKTRGLAFGTGLLPGVEGSAEFFMKEKIVGPMFNNYDIGGYLIYYLHTGSEARAAQQVFTDNRPEAYSVDFFQKIYIPAQQDPKAWETLDAKYNFNVIFFSHRDYTPWGQAFLISRVQDPAWAPIYVDAYNIIFVKKNPQNLELIRKYLIPPENFGVTRN